MAPHIYRVVTKLPILQTFSMAELPKCRRQNRSYRLVSLLRENLALDQIINAKLVKVFDVLKIPRIVTGLKTLVKIVF